MWENVGHVDATPRRAAPYDDGDDYGDGGDETEFDAIARDVDERLTEVGDPRVASIVAKWVAKLTADGRGPGELDYLRLLRYMMANRRIGRPFRRHPPAGRLPALNEYLRPRAGASAARCDRRTAGVGCRGGPRTDDDRYGGGGRGRHDRYDDDDDDKWSERGRDDGTADGDRGTTTTTTDDVESYATDYGDDDDAAASNPERDGHLTGGGGRGNACWDAASVSPGKPTSAAATKNVVLFDPCLDGWALHMKKRRPGPVDPAYADLLGGCALPEFTGAERAAVGPELLRVIQGVHDETTLQEFYFQVALYTCDQGSLMMKMSDDMVDKFRAFVSDVFDNRVEHISDGLAYEQMSVRHKYAYLRDRALNRATMVLDFLREAMPTFNWHKYWAEPDAYLKRQILRPAARNGDDRAQSCDDETTATKGRGCGGDDDDDDEDGARQQSAIKKMLYTLNWLRSEEARMNCQSDQLYEQRGDLNAQLVQLNVQLSTAQCRAADDIGRHKDEVTLLRQQSADQAATIDRLLESIQLATVDKNSQPNEC